MNKPVATLNYKGFTINVYQDPYPINPFEDWDGIEPTMVEYSGGGKDYSDGAIMNYLAHQVLTDGQIIYHQKAIIDALGMCDSWFEHDNRDDKIWHIRNEIYNCMNFDQLEAFCELFNIPCYNATSRGYSQGDWAEVFILPTPKWCEEVGAKPTQESMEATFELYGYWAWGDVYQYDVVDSDGEHIDSCSGFYGGDHKKSELLGYAEDVIDCEVDRRRKKRLERLKQLITNKVPLYLRTKLLPY